MINEKKIKKVYKNQDGDKNSKLIVYVKENFVILHLE